MVPTVGPNGSNGLLSVLLPAVQKCRGLAQALNSRAMLRLGEGKPDAAWADLMAAHRLARFVGCGGTLIEGLVSMALEAIVTRSELAFLDRAGLDARGIRACVRDLEALPPIQSTADMVDGGERFFLLETIMRIAARGPDVLFRMGILDDDDPRLPKQAFDGVDWDPALRDANVVFDRLSAAMRDPDLARRKAALDKLDAGFKKLKADQGANSDRPLFDPTRPCKPRGSVGEPSDGPGPGRHQGRIAFDRPRGWANLRIAPRPGRVPVEHKAYPKTLDELAPKY